jgi:hypothetical protein
MMRICVRTDAARVNDGSFVCVTYVSVEYVVRRRRANVHVAIARYELSTRRSARSCIHTTPDTQRWPEQTCARVRAPRRAARRPHSTARLVTNKQKTSSSQRHTASYCAQRRRGQWRAVHRDRAASPTSLLMCDMVRAHADTTQRTLTCAHKASHSQLR